jgi:nuclear transport factor 2 (NTF2) superfamily protein
MISPNQNFPPPFTRETATLKVRPIEDKLNSRNPEQLAHPGLTELGL